MHNTLSAARRAVQEQRVQRAVELRARGLSVNEIARAIGYGVSSKHVLFWLRAADGRDATPARTPAEIDDAAARAVAVLRAVGADAQQTAAALRLDDRRVRELGRVRVGLGDVDLWRVLLGARRSER